MIHPAEVFGLEQAVATKKCLDDGLTVRIIEIDGEKMVCTRDLRFDRMNLAIEDGLVFRAYIG